MGHFPPPPPPDRIINEGVGKFCSRCGSTMSKDGFLGIFGKRSCDNPVCKDPSEIRNMKINTILK